MIKNNNSHKKTQFVAFALCLGIFAPQYATANNYDFSSYEPTLTEQYPSTSNINSSYTLDYAIGNSGDYDLVYHKLNDDNTIENIYYKINIGNNISKNGNDLSRITNAAEGQNVEGYFHNITNRAISVGRNTMGNVFADFVNNRHTTATGNAAGAALMNSAVKDNDVYIYSGITSIVGDFINNRVHTNASGTDASNNPYYAAGGVLYMNRNTIGSIKANFVGNHAISEYGRAYGGALHTTNIPTGIDTIEGDFIGNYAHSYRDTAIGGAINTGGYINTLTGTFVSNYVETNGINVTAPITRIAEALGGSLHIGAVASVGKINADFYSNYALSAATAAGGAIYNLSTVKVADITGDFIGNYAKSTNATSYYALGGAIYTNSSLTFSAAGRDISFTSNYTEDRRGKLYNSIFVNTNANGKTLNFNVSSNGTITINDSIIGATTTLNYGRQFDINIEGDNTGSVIFNANIINAGNVNVKNTTIELGSYDHKDNTTSNNYGHGLFVQGAGTSPVTKLSLDNSTLTLSYDKYQELRLLQFAATNTSYLSFNADFATGQSDSINADTTSGSINLKRINITDDIAAGQSVTLFSGAAMNIDNINEFTLVYKNYDYKFSHNGNILTVLSKDLGNDFPYYIAVGESMDIEDSTYDNRSTKGIAVNDNELVVADSTFSNNSNAGNQYNSAGDGGIILNRTNGILEVINSNFTNNTASGLGGAIYSAEDFIISADAKNSVFSNNYDANGSNDIYMEDGKTLTLHVINGGNIKIESGINGAGTYNLNIMGDNESTINLNSLAQNVDNVAIAGAVFKLSEESNLSNVGLSLDHGTLDIANNKIGSIVLKELTSTMGSIMLDVDPKNNTSDLLKIDGDISGTIHLVVNSLSTVRPGDKILFAEAYNDDLNTDSAFEVYRVIGSPYNWEAIFNSDIKEWYLGTLGREGMIDLAPEAIAYLGLHSASLEQTRSMVTNIKNKVSANKTFCRGCGIYDDGYNNQNLYNAWVNPIFYTSTVKNPVHVESDIWGIEAGFDIQNNANNKLGIFASYRKGDYDLNGDGKFFYSEKTSSIDIDSYIGGLYYRYDKRNSWVFATVYGGVQKADIKTSDGIKTNTDGQQLGAGIEVGHQLTYRFGLNLEPSFGVYYNQINFENISDEYGKTAKYDTIYQTEFEAAIKFEKVWNYYGGNTKLYAKPSVVQLITSGDRLEISGMDNKLNTYHDQTLGRIEIGAKTTISSNISGYGFAGYTFGSNYEAGSFGLGLNISW